MGIPDCSEACLWKLPVELVFSVGAFLDGKALSSLVEALYSDKEQRILLGTMTVYIMKRMTTESIALLMDPRFNQLALARFVQTTLVPKSEEILRTLATNNNSGRDFIQKFSEWCLLMDYVLKGTRNNSLVWPVGAGVFATSPLSGGNMPLKTKVVLSVPVWHPSTVTLCHEVWLPHTAQTVIGAPTNFSWLPSEGDIDGFNPQQNIGVLSCFDDSNHRTFQATKALARDDDFLQAMGKPDCCLSILPTLDCPIFGSLLHALIQTSRRNAWMLNEEYCNKHMLCFFDSPPESMIDNNQNYTNAVLVERIIQLMKSCR